MILETPQYEASVDWLVSLYRRTGSSPSEILLDLLKHDPGALMPGLLDRAPGYISDMLALGRIEKKAVWAAASRIAQQKSPEDCVADVKRAKHAAESAERREPSAVARMIELTGLDSTAVLEALVESGTITTKQIGAATSRRDEGASE